MNIPMEFEIPTAVFVLALIGAFTVGTVAGLSIDFENKEITYDMDITSFSTHKSGHQDILCTNYTISSYTERDSSLKLLESGRDCQPINEYSGSEELRDLEVG